MNITFHMANGHIWQGTERDLRSNFTLQPWDRHTVKMVIRKLKTDDYGISEVHFKDGRKLVLENSSCN